MTAPTEERLHPNVERALYRADEVVFLVRCGEEPHRAAARVGVTLGAIEATLLRHGRKEEWREVYAALPLSLDDHNHGGLGQRPPTNTSRSGGRRRARNV